MLTSRRGDVFKQGFAHIVFDVTVEGQYNCIFSHEVFAQAPAYKQHWKKSRTTGDVITAHGKAGVTYHALAIFNDDDKAYPHNLELAVRNLEKRLLEGTEVGIVLTGLGNTGIAFGQVSKGGVEFVLQHSTLRFVRMYL